jgi:hypothetical protein
MPEAQQGLAAWIDPLDRIHLCLVAIGHDNRRPDSRAFCLHPIKEVCYRFRRSIG